jgi:hypothetical protein
MGLNGGVEGKEESERERIVVTWRGKQQGSNLSSEEEESMFNALAVDEEREGVEEEENFMGGRALSHRGMCGWV